MTHFQAIPVVGCGRCLFRSVATHGIARLSSAERFENGMIQDPDLHNFETKLADNIRMEVVDSIEKCYDELQPVILPHYTEYHGSLRDHITAMRSCSTFGDSLEVCAIAHLAKTQVHIIQRIGESYQVTQKTPLSEYIDQEPITLLYKCETLTQPGHYQLLLKKTSLVSRSDRWTPSCDSLFSAASARKTISLFDITMCLCADPVSSTREAADVSTTNQTVDVTMSETSQAAADMSANSQTADVTMSATSQTADVTVSATVQAVDVTVSATSQAAADMSANSQTADVSMSATSQAVDMSATNQIVNVTASATSKTANHVFRTSQIAPVHCKLSASIQPVSGTNWQPIIAFPKRLIGNQSRSFKVQWYKKFLWIEYDIPTDSVFCRICRTVANEETRKSLPHKHDDAFIKNGYRNWKNAVTSFIKHEKTSCHLACVSCVKNVEHGTNVHSKLNDEAIKQRLQNTDCLEVIVSSVKYLARQGLALRGKSDAEGNLKQLLTTRSSDNPVLAAWLKNKTNWTQWSIQNELLEMMSHEILRGVLAECQGFFSLIVDETMDINRQEQLVLCIRTVDSSLNVCEYFIGLYVMDKCDAGSISSAILDVLLRCNLSVRNLRGQAYDGASVMSGCNSGVGMRLLEIESRAVTIHCQAHSLNLAVQDACSRVAPLNCFMNNVNELLNFIRSSPKRLTELRKLADAFHIDVSLRPLCPTRWTLRYTALETLRKLLLPVHSELVAIAENSLCDRDARAKAAGFVQLLNKFEFYLMLIIACTLFEVTDRLSKVLQMSTISACEGKKAAESVVKTLKQWRSDSRFAEIFKDSLQLSSAVDAEPPTVPRQKKLPRRLDDGVPGHNFLMPEEYYRVLYFKVIDEAAGAIESRIHGKGYEILLTAERVLLKSFSAEPVQREDLNLLQEHFRDDLNFSRLKPQLEVLGNLQNSSAVSDLPSAVGLITSIGSGEKNLIPDVLILLKLCLILPASTASAERSFSTLRRIKTYLRSTMNQERLNHTMTLNIYKERLDRIDLKKLLNSFVDRNEMRRRTFAIQK